MRVMFSKGKEEDIDKKKYTIEKVTSEINYGNKETYWIQSLLSAGV